MATNSLSAASQRLNFTANAYGYGDTKQLLFCAHSCTCTSCMGDISQLCNNFQFVGPWQFCTLKYHPIKSNPAHLEHEKKIRQLLHHYTSSTTVPFLCLAIEEGCQWPQVLLVQPNAKLWARAVRCYILERIDPKPNDFNHTVNAVPTRESLAQKLSLCATIETFVLPMVNCIFHTSQSRIFFQSFFTEKKKD